jgi:hypothetical protein
VQVNLRVLNALQKSAPPLSDLNRFGAEQATGFPHIQTLATFHLFGHNLRGDKVELEFDLEVTFCKFCLAEEN